MKGMVSLRVSTRWCAPVDAVRRARAEDRAEDDIAEDARGVEKDAAGTRTGNRG
jgi:hypothetical protein